MTDTPKPTEDTEEMEENMNEWEKEFDTAWSLTGFVNITTNSLVKLAIANQIKDFIRKTILHREKQVKADLIERIEKHLKWDTGHVMYTNPDGKKYKVYNAEHINKFIQSLKEEL